MASPQRKAERIASIIKMQALLFGESAPGVSSPGVSSPGVSSPGVSSPGVSSPGEYEELLDFLEDRRPAKIERIVSILRAQEILLGSGDFLRGERAKAAAAEIPGLIGFATSLLLADRAPARKLAVLPHNLGRSFAAKSWGLPLFGDYRPSAPPDRGLLLVYGSPDRDGVSASIAACRLGPETRLAFDGPALVLDSSAKWIYLDALSADSLAAGIKLPGGRSRDEYLFSRYAISLDRRARARRLKGLRLDPYAYEYGYLFYDAPAAASNVARFASDLLSAILHLPPREAEKLADAFSERLPRS